MIEPVLIKELKDNLLFLRLNRPDRLNAINGALMDELLQATEEAAADSSVRAVVITGEGRSFCAGGDVRDGAKPKRLPGEEKPADPRQALIDSQYERTQASYLLHTMPKPTIALVRGRSNGSRNVAGAGLRFSHYQRHRYIPIRFRQQCSQWRPTGSASSSPKPWAPPKPWSC